MSYYVNLPLSMGILEKRGHLQYCSVAADRSNTTAGAYASEEKTAPPLPHQVEQPR